MHPEDQTISAVGCSRILECQFGQIAYADEDTLTFSEGLFGFSQYHRFLLWDDSQYVPFRWLISLDNPHLVFPVIDPRIACPDYDPKINSGEKWDSLLAVVTIGDSKESVTMNLRAPILVDDTSRSGKQVILTDTEYPLRYHVIH